jgi:hypothetical protein
MARVPFSGQSRYTDQLLQSVLIPTVVSNTTNGRDYYYTLETDLCASTLHVNTVYANTVNTSNLGLGNLADETLALGCQAMQGVYSCNVSTTVIGVRAAGNNNARGTFNGNVLVGAETGLNLCNTNYSIYLGAGAGTYGQGTSNVVVGYGAFVGLSGDPTTGNVILGAGAGKYTIGDSNVFIGTDAGADLTVSNTLVIHNSSDSDHSLIYGKFDEQQLGINCIPTTSFEVSGNALIRGNISVSGNLSISGFFTGDGLGINCIPTATFQVSGSSILKDLSASNVLARTLGVNCVPTETFGVSGNSVFDGDLTVLGVITGAVAPTGISGFAADLHGAGNGYYGGVGLFDASMTLSGNISNISTSTNYIGGVYFQDCNVSLGGRLVTPSNTLNHIGGVYLQNSNISLAGSISNLPVSLNRIGGVAIDNSNVTLAGTGRFTTAIGSSNSIGGVLLCNRLIDISTTNARLTVESGLVVGKLLLNVLGFPAQVEQFSINTVSSGSISNRSFSSNNIGGVTLSDGSISNISSSVNTIGGVRLDSGFISAPGRLTLSGAMSNEISTQNFIGGVYLSNGCLQTTSNSDNTVGGVRFLNSNITTTGYINVSGASNYIGGVYLENSNISLAGRITNLSSTSNSIGGVSLSGGSISLAGGAGSDVSFSMSNSGNRRIVLNRDGITVSENSSLVTIGGGQVSTTSGYYSTGVGGTSGFFATGGGKFSSESNSSNSIGGVTIESGRITNLSSTSNFIGGVYLLNSNISLGGTITNLSSTSNFIGGVTLSGGSISNISSSINLIGGVYLTNTNISLAGRITNLSTTSNYIGGVTLSGGIISNLSNSSNYIGGVSLSSNTMSIGLFYDVSGNQSTSIKTNQYRYEAYASNDKTQILIGTLGVQNSNSGIRGYNSGTETVSINASTGAISNSSSSSNSIGGVTLQDGRLSTLSFGLIYNQTGGPGFVDIPVSINGLYFASCGTGLSSIFLKTSNQLLGGNVDNSTQGTLFIAHTPTIIRLSTSTGPQLVVVRLLFEMQ